MNWLAEVITLELTVCEIRAHDALAVDEMDPIVEIGIRRDARRAQNERRYERRYAAYREAMFNFEQAERLRRGRGRIPGSVPGNAERHARYADAFRELGFPKLVGPRLNVSPSAASNWFLSFGAAHGLVKRGRRVVVG